MALKDWYESERLSGSRETVNDGDDQEFCLIAICKQMKLCGFDLAFDRCPLICSYQMSIWHCFREVKGNANDGRENANRQNMKQSIEDDESALAEFGVVQTKYGLSYYFRLTRGDLPKWCCKETFLTSRSKSLAVASTIMNEFSIFVRL